jgi:hypothetical protein
LGLGIYGDIKERIIGSGGKTKSFSDIYVLFNPGVSYLG